MDKIQRLQNELTARGIAAFLVPYSDEHQGEYLLPASKRLEWLFGFTGSAGLGVVTPTKAALFVDGRYTLQAPREVEGVDVVVFPYTKEAIHHWLAGIAVLAYDSHLHNLNELEVYEKGGFKLQAVDNPVDKLWENQPRSPVGNITIHHLNYAGQSIENKLENIFNLLQEKACVLNSLDSIAWLLNIRGTDTPHTPLAQGFVILKNHKAHFYVHLEKLAGLILPSCVDIHPLEEFRQGLSALNQPVLLDKTTTTAAIRQAITAQLVFGRDPVVDLRSIKNTTEIAGARTAHVIDGVAMVKFLHWFDKPHPKDELQVMAQLEAFRAESPLYKGASFTTIAGAGANAAIVHYRASESTNKPVPNNSLFLLDSGGQYEAGTTDITRTLAVGSISQLHKKHFTLVLKGMLALSRAKFPLGTGGVALDALARQFLWAEGLNYAHGTGHGVGSYLGVHEGVARFSPMGNELLKAGMILSNEPGFYEAESHGIRIENLLLIQPFNESFLTFETLTLCPIDTRAIDFERLMQEEITQLNAYHATIYAALSPHFTGERLAWLQQATAEYKA